jgi:YidC/Oxa1 family membrane protein insertase
MFMMPVIFGFIFYTMPSGLVLYWLTNTILMSLYQLHLKKITLT